MEGKGVLAENLPEEVMNDILSRLPIKPIIQFRCVSKSWLHLLSFDPQFKKLHSQATNNGNQPPGIIALKLGKHKLYYAPDYAACDKAIEFDLPFNKPSNGHYFIFGICNGLICFSLHKPSNEDSENLSNVYVWNPFTSNHITIPCPLVTCTPAMGASFGFGYHEASDEYKVIRLLWSRLEVAPSISIYTLGTASWRSLDDIPYNVIFHNSRVPLVNGALHWIATKINLPSSKTIISFDIKDEVFQEIPLPNRVKHDGSSKVKVGEFNGLLCVSYADNIRMCQLWVMKEYGVVDSWLKQCEFKLSAIQSFPCSGFSLFEPLGRAGKHYIIMRTGPWNLILCNSVNSSTFMLKSLEGGCVYALFTHFGKLTSPKSCPLS